MSLKLDDLLRLSHRLLRKDSADQVLGRVAPRGKIRERATRQWCRARGVLLELVYRRHDIGRHIGIMSLEEFLSGVMIQRRAIVGIIGGIESTRRNRSE